MRPEHVVIAIFPALLLLAAATDLFSLTIPNWLTLAIAGAFFAIAPAASFSWADIGGHILCGGFMLALGFGAFARGWIGGGDAKLFAAIGLWLGWLDAGLFALTASLLGGALTLCILALRAAPLPARLAPAWLARLHDPREGVPYGVALSAAALAVYSKSPWLPALTAAF